MNIARLFSAYRLLERQAARERVRHRVAEMRLRRERDEWANKFLAKVQTPPLFHEPPKAAEPVEPPPIGPSAKRALLAKQNQNSTVKSDEQILEAARVASANGHSK